MIPRRWPGAQVIVAATGPSLTSDVAERCRRASGYKIVAVNDAYRLMPFADVLYACDAAWWQVHKGCSDFQGERWSTRRTHNDTTMVSCNLHLVDGKYADGFSLDPALIHYGKSSGFQAINLAILFGAARIVLVGFDMHIRKGRHFFGNHPRPLTNSIDFETWVPIFDQAARMLPRDIEIINATPGSALTCFKTMDLECALSVGFGEDAASGSGQPPITPDTLPCSPQCSSATAAIS